MNITIKMLDGTTRTMRVNPADTLGSLKRCIQTELGVPVHKQRLILSNGNKISLTDDSKPVSNYGLREGSQVSLLITEPPPIQVFLKTDKGETKTYDITAEETVADFKKRVEHREGVPSSQQRLIHEDQEMTGRKLSDYNVKALSTIHLALRLRGG